LNVYVKELPKDFTPAQLEKSFADSIGPVKSTKISKSAQVTRVPNQNGKLIKQTDLAAPPLSNGYGFVCFQTEADARKAVEIGKFGVIQTQEYKVIERTDTRKLFNNIYVKNFNPDWSEENLKAIFSKYGDIKSLIVLKKKDKEGIEKPFAFVCFERPGQPTYGPECASRAVEDLHDKELDGFKIYVQPALPADQRQAQVFKEQQRFKNSKKKCNLFVKGFPATYSSDDLKNLFSQFGEIESVKILPTTEGQNASRAFVCFKTPDSAAQARARLHQQTIDSKQLFVTNYELPEIRKKQQADAKDKADFMNLRKQNSAPLDPSLLQRPDTIQLIQQILFLIQRQVGNRGGFGGGYNRPAQGGFNNQRQQRGPGQNIQQQQPYPRPMNNMNRPAPAEVPQNAPIVQIRQDVAGDVGSIGPQAPLPHPDPIVNKYNMDGFGLLPAVFPGNPNLKQMVGEFIYEYVGRLVGEERAPKITGMLIDLPLEEIKGYLYDFTKLHQKVGEAINLLVQIQQQQQAPQ